MQVDSLNSNYETLEKVDLEEKAECEGLDIDDELLQFLEKAAQANDSDAIVELGLMFQFGNGVEPNERTAFFLFGHAVKLNNSKAINCLADLYLVNDEENKDYEKIKLLYERAANLGDKDAQKSLIRSYKL